VGNHRRLHPDIAVNIGDGIDDGFSDWNWIIVALGVVFIVEAASRLRT